VTTDLFMFALYVLALETSIIMLRICSGIHRKCGYHVSTGNTAEMNEMSWAAVDPYWQWPEHLQKVCQSLSLFGTWNQGEERLDWYTTQGHQWISYPFICRTSFVL